LSYTPANEGRAFYARPARGQHLFSAPTASRPASTVGFPPDEEPGLRTPRRWGWGTPRKKRTTVRTKWRLGMGDVVVNAVGASSPVSGTHPMTGGSRHPGQPSDGSPSEICPRSVASHPNQSKFLEPAGA